MAGLPATLFNADFVTSPQGPTILIIEGEKKSIITAQAGFPNVGIMGKSSFKPEWARAFAPFEVVYVALDPDATGKAYETAKLFEGRGRVVSLPEKLDDMITMYGATPRDVQAFVDAGRPV